MRYAIIWYSLAGLLVIAFAVSLRGDMPGIGCKSEVTGSQPT
jgi:cytochrome oxidase assembly protein ShyY1